MIQFKKVVSSNHHDIEALIYATLFIGIIIHSFIHSINPSSIYPLSKQPSNNKNEQG